MQKINDKTEGTEVAFAQARDLSEVTCYHCGKKGITLRHAPKRVKKGTG